MQNIFFSKILKNFEIYLELINWLKQYISYYTQQMKLLQNRKTALLYEDSTADQTRKNYSKKTLIFDVNKLEKKIFEFIQKFFDDLNFLHHQNLNWWLYVDLNVSKWHRFDVMIYHMQNNHDSLLNHTVKENWQKIESILFFSKLLTDAEIQYWHIKLKIVCLIWIIKKFIIW